MSTHPALPRKYCRTFRQRSGTSGGQHASSDHPQSDADVGVVDIKIFWFPSTHPPSGMNSPPGLIVVHRVMACGLWGASRQRLPIPQSPNGESSNDDSVAERLTDAFDDYVAKHLVDPAWKKSSEFWVTPVCEDAAAVAESIGGLQDQWHDLVLGKPVEYLAGPMPLQDIAKEFALPGDTVITGIKHVIQIGGILFGLASGQPLLVNACLKSLVHDALLKVVAAKIGAFLGSTLEPAADPFERDLVITREERDYITELKESLGTARDNHQEHGQPVPHKFWPDQDELSHRVQPPVNPNAPFGAFGDFHVQENRTAPHKLEDGAEQESYGSGTDREHGGVPDRSATPDVSELSRQVNEQELEVGAEPLSYGSGAGPGRGDAPTPDDTLERDSENDCSISLE
jgi:hypothetical protein